MNRFFDGFRSELDALPGQFLPALATEDALAGFGRVVFAGMGGSGLAAGFAAAWAARSRETHVVHDTALPGWVGESDLVVCVSASGDTMETLAVWEEAGARGCARAAVASGGALLREAEATGTARVAVPGGLAPRSSLGYLLRGALAVCGNPGPDGDEVAAHLEGVRLHALGSETDTEVPAADLAWSFHGVLPLVLAGDPLGRLAARRWVADLAENAEVPAQIWEVPESNHNRIMILARQAPRRIPVVAVSLGTPRDPRAAHLWNGTLDVLREVGIALLEVSAPHPDPWIEALGLAYLGDWVSVFLAEIEGTPAADISFLGELKERLREPPKG